MSYAVSYAESRGTLQVCVPEQANGSTMKDSYEVQRSSPPRLISEVSVEQ
jgi:hypothetical protein